MNTLYFDIVGHSKHFKIQDYSKVPVHTYGLACIYEL
jgi:hypothetical protein